MTTGSPAPTPAVEDPSIEALGDMLDALNRYFAAEVVESWIFIGLAITFVVVSVLLRHRASGWAAAAYPLVGIALIQLTVGAFILLRTSRQVKHLRGQLLSSPYAYADAELQRMAEVSSDFVVYEIIEIVLLAVGLALLWRGRSRPRRRAIGAGLAVGAGIMLILDIVAQVRADDYAEAIIQHIGRPPGRS